MASCSKLCVLAFAAAVVAYSPSHIGRYHGYGHGLAHSPLHSAIAASAAPFPYHGTNSTGLWAPTGTASPSTAVTAPGQAAAPADTSSQPVSLVDPSNAVQAESDGGSGDAAGGDQCGQQMTVTHTEQVYVTVPAGQPPPASSDSSPVGALVDQPDVTSTLWATLSAAPSAPWTLISGPPAASSPAPLGPPNSSVPTFASTSSSAASVLAPSSVSRTPSTASALSTLSAAYSQLQKHVPSSSADAAAPTYSSPGTTGSTSGRKRGLAYNSADLTKPFHASDEITWAYNWVSASGGLTGNLKYIPTLHDRTETFTTVWNDEASAAIQSGSTVLFSFNEPDQSGQATMSPTDAAAAYIKYMNPFAGKAQLCAPSVTNGPASQNMGLTWLQQFLDACAGQCHIDCYNVHWYAVPDAQSFKEHVSSATDMAGDKPVWVSEFGCIGASNDQVNTFLEDVMPWMDSHSGVAGYAYFMVSDGALLSGTSPSTYGTTYMSYTA